MLDRSPTDTKDVTALAQPTQMEEARQGFVRSLRKFVMVDLEHFRINSAYILSL